MSIVLKTVADSLKTRKLTVLITGASGLGKTSLMKSLPYSPEEILLIAADPGQMALKAVPEEMLKKKNLPEYLGRDFTSVHYLAPKTQEEFREAALYVQKEAHKRFKMVVVDGLDEVGEDALRFYKDKQRGMSKPNMMVAYGEMADNMEALMSMILDAPMSSIFITHLDECEPGGTHRYGPRFPGKQLSLKIPDKFDEIWCLRMGRLSAQDKVAQRVLQTRPDIDPQYLTKDRSGALDDFERPNLTDMMNKVFSTVKE